jgi:hypothetical protein
MYKIISKFLKTYDYNCHQKIYLFSPHIIMGIPSNEVDSFIMASGFLEI